MSIAESSQPASAIDAKRPAIESPVSRIQGFDVMRPILGAVLLIAAGLKIHQLARGSPVAGDRLFSSRLAQATVVYLELLLGVWLAAGMFRRVLWGAALACFAVFGMVATFRALDGQASCGCFGSVSVNPWITACLDLAAVIALLWFRPKATGVAGRPSDSNTPRRLAIAGAAWAILASAATLAIVRYKPPVLTSPDDIVGDVSFVVLEPESWIGKRFPLAGHIDIGPKLMSGRWVVVFYRHDCSHCREEMPQLERRARDARLRSDALGFAVVSVPPHASSGDDIVTRNTDCVVGHLNAEREWFVQTPAQVSVVNGIVVENELIP